MIRIFCEFLGHWFPGSLLEYLPVRAKTHITNLQKLPFIKPVYAKLDKVSVTLYNDPEEDADTVQKSKNSGSLHRLNQIQPILEFHLSSFELRS